MLDPLTALGVAGNVLQIIDFGFQLVADGNEIYHSAAGASDETKAADELATDLEGLTRRLSESQTEWTKSHGDVPLEPDEVHLRNICERCTDIAVDLQRQLQKLKREDGGKRRRLKSYKQALISVWRKDHIDAIATRLARYQQELDTHILISLRKSVRESEWKNSEQFASLEHQTQDLTVAVLQGGNMIDSRLTDQDDVLARIYEQTSQILAALNLKSRDTVHSARPNEPVVRRNSVTGLALHEAVCTGSVVELKQLLQSSTCDVNAPDKLGCRPLHVAPKEEAAKALLADRRMEKNVLDNEGRTPLHHAVLKRRLDVVKVLLEAGVDKSIEDVLHKTARFYARDCPTALWLLDYGPEVEARARDHLKNTGLLHMAWIGDVEGTEFFIKHGGDVNARNTFHETALTEASRHGSTDIVAILLKAGANIELADRHGYTPLLQAVRDNRTQVVPLLLRPGASKEAKLRSGNTPLAEACFQGHFEIAEMLVTAGCNIEAINHLHESPLQRAAAADRSTLVQMLTKRKANVNFSSRDGMTSVHSAAMNGSVESLKILLDAGADHSAVSSNGLTALGHAATKNNYECAELLLDYGADVHAYQFYDNICTVLGVAARHGSTEVLELLLDHGAKIDDCTLDGRSGLALAAQSGYDAAIKLLVERGAALEHPKSGSVDPEGEMIPLMVAASSGHHSTVSLLLALGANVDPRDAHGGTPLRYAAEEGYEKVVRVLLDGGADVNVQASDGQTALFRTAYKGRVAVVKQLVEAKANPRLRDWRGCNAWTEAVMTNHDRALEHLLKPAPDEDENVRWMQGKKSPSEIAAYMNETYG